MFTKVYLTITIVLRCYKKILEFFMAFYGSSPVIICSYLFLKQKLCVFVSAVPYRLVEIAN